MQIKIHRHIVTFDSKNIIMSRTSEVMPEVYNTEDDAHKKLKSIIKDISDFLQEWHQQVVCCKTGENAFSTWLGVQFADGTQAEVKYEVISVEG